MRPLRVGEVYDDHALCIENHVVLQEVLAIGLWHEVASMWDRRWECCPDKQ